MGYTPRKSCFGPWLQVKAGVKRETYLLSQVSLVTAVVTIFRLGGWPIQEASGSPEAAVPPRGRVVSGARAEPRAVGAGGLCAGPEWSSLGLSATFWPAHMAVPLFEGTPK